MFFTAMADIVKPGTIEFFDRRQILLEILFAHHEDNNNMTDNDNIDYMIESDTSEET